MECLNDTIQYRIIEMDDAERIVQFIVDYFYKYEPLCSCEPIMETDAADQQDIVACIQEGLSVMAFKIDPIDGHEDICGVNLAQSKTAKDIDKYIEIAEIMGDQKWGKIMKLLAYVNLQANIFERYSVSKVLYSFMSCVHPTYRGKSLGIALKTQLMALGKENDYTVLTADCTSYYSARVCEQLGMECVFQIAYRDYRDENDKPIFEPPLPHQSIKSFAIKIK